MGGNRGLADVIPRLLEYLHTTSEPRAALYWLLVVMSETSGCESTAIRWRAGEDYPYYVSRGFSQEFLEREGSLLRRDATRPILQDEDGKPQLACICGTVVQGRTDPSYRFFSADGSFWTNGTTALLRDMPLSDMIGVRGRNYCNEAGYESLALIPLRADGNTYGLLQLNSRKPGRFTALQIEEYEKLGLEVASAVLPRIGGLPGR